MKAPKKGIDLKAFKDSHCCPFDGNPGLRRKIVAGGSVWICPKCGHQFFDEELATIS